MMSWRARIVALCVSVLLSTTLAQAEQTGGSGLALAPGLTFIEGITPGTTVALHERGLPLTVFNRGGQTLTAELLLSDYIPYSLSHFECGFEYIPDASWVSVTPAQRDIPAGEQQRGQVTVTIPDRPEHWNRHYVICVETGRPVRTALGATLRMQARILVETAAKDMTPTVGPRGALGVAPSRIVMQAGKDNTWSGAASVISGAEQEATYDVLTIGQVYPPQLADRHGRFFSTNVTAQTHSSWATCQPASFTLAPGAIQQLKYRAQITRQLNAKERVDEVFFIARRALPSTDPKHLREAAGQRYDRMELLRLSYTPTP
jgi:hypothetical protein